jgi:hypothetical protein
LTGGADVTQRLTAETNCRSGDFYFGRSGENYFGIDNVHYTFASTAARGGVANDAEVGTNATRAWKAFPRTGLATSQIVSGLTRTCCPYRVRVRARTTHGGGAWVFGAGTPRGLGATAPPDVYVDKHPTVTTSLSVRWDRVAGATAYNMQVRLAGATSTLSTPANLGANVGTDAIPHDLTGLTAGTAYEVRVRATNSVLWSNWTRGTPGTEATTEWSATLSTGTDTTALGCIRSSQCQSRLSSRTITVDGTAFTINRVLYEPSIESLSVWVAQSSTSALHALRFCTGALSLPMTGNTTDPATGTQVVIAYGVDPGWHANTQVEVRIGSNCALGATMPPNSPRILSIEGG